MASMPRPILLTFRIVFMGFAPILCLLSFVASVVCGYDVLVNEDKTRSFVCLRVRGGRQMILKLIAKVDPLMRRFRQSEYYEVMLRSYFWPTRTLSIARSMTFPVPCHGRMYVFKRTYLLYRGVRAT